MAGTRLINADGTIITVNNRIAVAAMQAQGYKVVPKGSKVATTKKKVNNQNNTVAAKNREKRIQQDIINAKGKGTYKPGYDIKDFENISFKDYMRIKDNANNSTFAGAFLGTNKKLRDAAKYIEDHSMVKEFDPETDQATIDDIVARNNPGQTHPAVARKYNFDADGVAAADKNNNSPTATYNDGFGGTGTILNANYPVQTVVGPTSSLDNGSGRATVQTSPKRVVTPKSFQQWQSNSLEDDLAQETTDVPIHPVTGLRIEKGDNWNSYTEAPSGTTFHNSNFNWNNKGFKTPTGNVAGLSQQEIDGLYGRPPSPVQPKQEVDFSGFADWWRKNVGK